MVFELLKRAIEQKNAFMTEDIIRLQIEFFYTAGRLAPEEYNELIAMLTPETGDANESTQSENPETV